MDFKNLLDDAVDKGQLKTLNTELTAVIYVYGNYQVIRYWNLTGRKTPKEELIDFLISLIKKAVNLLGRRLKIKDLITAR